MNYYLFIAESVLKIAKVPLTAKQILEHAYMAQMVPSHLHGKTQHKTLNARLSTDIRSKGTTSAFYRVDPGTFFLRELKGLPNLPEEYREDFQSRPRFRELVRDAILTIPNDMLVDVTTESYIEAEQVLSFFSDARIKYQDLKRQENQKFTSVWSFVIVHRDKQILTYRLGSYREKKNEFVNLRTIGFKTPLTINDSSFFEQNDLGLISAGLKSTFADLGVPPSSIDLEHEKKNANLEFAIYVRNDDGEGHLICITTYTCPSWLEPLKRRLAINDLRWASSTHMPNNIDDFDVWSKKIIPALIKIYQTGRSKK